MTSILVTAPNQLAIRYCLGNLLYEVRAALIVCKSVRSESSDPMALRALVNPASPAAASKIAAHLPSFFLQRNLGSQPLAFALHGGAYLGGQAFALLFNFLYATLYAQVSAKHLVREHPGCSNVLGHRCAR